MNQVVMKKAVIFALILGMIIGLISVIPFLIGLCLFFLAFLSSIFVMLYMRKDEKYVAYLTNEQGAIMGGAVGFFATVGFFLTFSPMVCILKMIFKNYYSYMIPDLLSTALWLFFVLAFMVALILAMTNSATGMGLAFLFNTFQEKPENYDARLDIKIED